MGVILDFGFWILDCYRHSSRSPQSHTVMSRCQVRLCGYTELYPSVSYAAPHIPRPERDAINKVVLLVGKASPLKHRAATGNITDTEFIKRCNFS